MTHKKLYHCYAILPVILLMLSTAVQAQTPARGEHVLNLQTGATFYTGHLLGAAAPSSHLRSGFTWAGSYTYVIGTRATLRPGIGLMYQGNRYTADVTNASDKIRTNYLAPQFSLHLINETMCWHLTLGYGYQWYRDAGTVYGKPRKVTMNKIAGNIGLGGEYRLPRHWGIRAGINYIIACSDSYSVRYREETWEVRPHYRKSENSLDDISQMSVFAGLSYHF